MDSGHISCLSLSSRRHALFPRDPPLFARERTGALKVALFGHGKMATMLLEHEYITVVTSSSGTSYCSTNRLSLRPISSPFGFSFVPPFTFQTLNQEKHVFFPLIKIWEITSFRFEEEEIRFRRREICVFPFIEGILTKIVNAWNTDGRIIIIISSNLFLDDIFFFFFRWK